jgi:predicted membrane GTPase involved in stress response
MSRYKEENGKKLEPIEEVIIEVSTNSSDAGVEIV